MKMFSAFALVAVLSLPGTARAFCFDEAGAAYNIPPDLLRAVAQVESGMNPYAVNRNGGSTVSYDYGLMQINSQHMASLRPRVWEKVLADPCMNVYAGAWVLASCINVYGYNWRAVGCYNAGTGDSLLQEKKRAAYAWKVYRVLTAGGESCNICYRGE